MGLPSPTNLDTNNHIPSTPAHHSAHHPAYILHDTHALDAIDTFYLTFHSTPTQQPSPGTPPPFDPDMYINNVPDSHSPHGDIVYDTAEKHVHAPYSSAQDLTSPLHGMQCTPNPIPMSPVTPKDNLRASIHTVPPLHKDSPLPSSLTNQNMTAVILPISPWEFSAAVFDTTQQAALNDVYATTLAAKQEDHLPHDTTLTSLSLRPSPSIQNVRHSHRRCAEAGHQEHTTSHLTFPVHQQTSKHHQQQTTTLQDPVLEAPDSPQQRAVPHHPAIGKIQGREPKAPQHVSQQGDSAHCAQNAENKDVHSDELRFVMAARKVASAAKLQFRKALKAIDQAEQEAANKKGRPWCAKTKAVARSRRESAVSRRRTEVYIRELEEIAKMAARLQTETRKDGTQSIESDGRKPSKSEQVEQS